MPERFKPRQIDDIVKKYILGGISKAKAKEILIREGFKVTEKEIKESLNDCTDCDGVVIIARYERSILSILSSMYDYRIVIEIGFRKDNVAVVRGWHIKNAY